MKAIILVGLDLDLNPTLESIIPAYNIKRIKPKEGTLSFKDEEDRNGKQ